MSNNYFLLLSVLFLFTLSFPGYNTQFSSPPHHSDEEALLSFKSSLSGYPNSSLFDWSSHHSYCNWTGVSCSSHHQQRVVSLNLSGMSLVGPISPFLGNLSFLRVLDLRNNSFEGQIPSQFRRLFRLRVLQLSKNKLEGSIPPTLGDCHSLQYLDLSHNHLSNNIPSKLGRLSHLETLYLGENQLTGIIPTSLGNLSSLIELELQENKLVGGIPVELGKLTQLKVLYLDTNNLSRSIPKELGMLTQLKELFLRVNNLTGVIPATLSNCTLLQSLIFYDNQLSGHIPWQFGKLSKLQELNLWGNQLTGEIPTSLSNCTNIQVLALEKNRLVGRVPSEFGKLLHLRRLCLLGNNLVNKNNDLSFLTALTNCSSLSILDLSHNYLTGILPDSISQLSSQLSIFSLASNKMEGNIPNGIGNLTNLTYLDLSNNHFNGTIPSTIGQLLNLERLFLDKNSLYGRIPESLGGAKKLGLLSLSENMILGEIPNALGDLPQIRELILHHNQLSGKLPASLGRCITLQKVDLAHNKLEGNMPLEWASLTYIQFYFNVSRNLLEGSISIVSKMVMVQAIDVSLNNLSGEIPISLSSCTNLIYLNLSSNSFEGPIPSSLTALKNLEDIDLSRNNLSGAIPMAFQEMKTLQHINLSSNSLTGEVPNGGIFSTIDDSAILGNVGLCGKRTNLQPCSNSKHKHFSVSKKVILPTVIGIAIFIMSSIFCLIIYRRRSTNHNTLDLSIDPKIISYEELVDATDGFSETNQIGVGSFGSVYRGILKNGTNIAIKVLNFQDEKSLQTFDRECNVLKRVRHRNVIKIISACYNLDFKALILPFMANGNLERWLYPDEGDECRLSLSDRLRIAKEIAQGMEYLHHHCFVQVIHCDLKPANVLLGDDMTPYIADFGITKLLFENSKSSFNSTSALKGSIGYFAPEYGMGGQISTKGDVYSYGILLLELLTRKRPTDSMFVEGINLPKWTSMYFPNKFIEVVDNYLLRDVNELDEAMVLACISQFMQVGLVCTRDLPQQRPNMMEVVERLEKITSAFLGAPRDFHLPIDISPFLESTSAPKNVELGSIENYSTSTS